MQVNSAVSVIYNAFHKHDILSNNHWRSRKVKLSKFIYMKFCNHHLVMQKG